MRVSFAASAFFLAISRPCSTSISLEKPIRYGGIGRESIVSSSLRLSTSMIFNASARGSGHVIPYFLYGSGLLVRHCRWNDHEAECADSLWYVVLGGEGGAELHAYDFITECRFIMRCFACFAKISVFKVANTHFQTVQAN